MSQRRKPPGKVRSGGAVSASELMGLAKQLRSYRQDKTIRAALASVTNKAKDNMLSVAEGSRKDQDRSGHLYIDGLYNDLPNYVVETVYGSDEVASSATATAMLEKKIQFVSGNGFTESRLEGLSVSETQTFEELHHMISRDFTTFGRFAIKVYWKRGILTGEAPTIGRLEHVPVQYLRVFYAEGEKNKTGKVVYNPLFGHGDYRSADNKVYPTFDPSKAKEDMEAGHVCQIFYYQNKAISEPIYSRPSWWSARNAIKVDAAIDLLHERNVANNFFLGALLTMIGDPDAPVETREDGTVVLTAKEEFEQDLHDIAGGARNAGSVLTFWTQTKEQVPQISPIPANTNDNLYAQVSDLIRDKIAIAFQIPRIIAGIETAGKLGDSKEIRNAVLLANESTSIERHSLEAVYAKILPYMGYTGEVEIVEKTIDAEVELTKEEWDWLDDQQKAEYLSRKLGYEVKPPQTEMETAENEQPATPVNQ